MAAGAQGEGASEAVHLDALGDFDAMAIKYHKLTQHPSGLSDVDLWRELRGLANSEVMRSLLMAEVDAIRASVAPGHVAILDDSVAELPDGTPPALKAETACQ